MKSIKFLSLISFLLYTSICFAQSDSPCKITDTLYIPFGFSHILTANSPLLAVMDDLEVVYDSVEVKRSDNNLLEAVSYTHLTLPTTPYV